MLPQPQTRAMAFAAGTTEARRAGRGALAVLDTISIRNGHKSCTQLAGKQDACATAHWATPV
jgi:hypothetical protein